MYLQIEVLACQKQAIKNNQRKNNERKTGAIFSKLLEISTILNPQAYDPSFKEPLRDLDPTIDQNAIGKMSQLYSLEVIENVCT
jgi:hypothetical protein